MQPLGARPPCPLLAYAPVERDLENVWVALCDWLFSFTGAIENCHRHKVLQVFIIIQNMGLFVCKRYFSCIGSFLYRAPPAVYVVCSLFSLTAGFTGVARSRNV